MTYRLDYVLALAEERNLTKAAQKLYISQPTLTKYITRLEQDLGVQLFDRSVQPTRITRAEYLLPEVLLLPRAFDPRVKDAVARATAEAARVSGVARI